MKLLKALSHTLLIIVMAFMFIVFMFSFGGCTENSRVKNFGGTGEITLEQGQKLVMVTWKEDNLWILTREMKDTDVVETYKFTEESSFGMMEGTYIIYEVK